MGWGPCDIGLQYSKFPIECYFWSALKQETQQKWTTANKWYKCCCFSFAFETIISIGQAVLESYSHKQFLFPGPSHIWNSKHIDAKLLGFRTWRALAATYQKSTKRTHTVHKHLRGLGSQHPKTNKIHMLKAYLSNQKNCQARLAEDTKCGRSRVVFIIRERHLVHCGCAHKRSSESRAILLFVFGVTTLWTSESSGLAFLISSSSHQSSGPRYGLKSRTHNL